MDSVIVNIQPWKTYSIIVTIMILETRTSESGSNTMYPVLAVLGTACGYIHTRSTPGHLHAIHLDSTWFFPKLEYLLVPDMYA